MEAKSDIFLKILKKMVFFCGFVLKEFESLLKNGIVKKTLLLQSHE